jgi:TPR repeat protein
MTINYDGNQRTRFVCCGKQTCLSESCSGNLVKKWNDTCPMCRANFPKTDEEEIERIRIHAQRSAAWAQYQLGVSYMNGFLGLEINEVKGLFWLYRAVDQGYSRAQVSLGDYHRENGDYQSSINLYKLAAINNDPRGQFNLALTYRTGQGCSPNTDGCFKWMLLAAEVMPEAQYIIAVGYMEGVGITKDHEKAKYWLKRAALSGHPGACSTLEILKAMEIETRD